MSGEITTNVRITVTAANALRDIGHRQPDCGCPAGTKGALLGVRGRRYRVTRREAVSLFHCTDEAREMASGGDKAALTALRRQALKAESHISVWESGGAVEC